MTQVSSLPSSTADVNDMYNNKRLPKGIHIVGADKKSVSKVGGMSKNEEEDNVQNLENTDIQNKEDRQNNSGEKTESKKKKSGPPWGYIFIQHMSAGNFERKLESLKIDGTFRPKCFIHRTVRYKQKPNGKGIMKEEKPTVSGLVFLQGETKQLKSFLIHNFPQYYLVNDCSTGKPATIADSLMRPFMKIMEEEPERVTFLRDPFIKFAKDHVKLRVLTGIMAGQVGYVVRILKNRQLVMDFGGYAVAINDVHNEDFEIAE